MTTKTASKKRNTTKAPRNNKTSVLTPVLTEYLTADLAPDLIDFSPLNYRKWYDPQDLEAFSEVLKIHGIIHSLLLRPAGKRYELIIGERRLRAARIAGLSTIPCRIIPLTDEEVREIQLTENIHRENPHPFHEAQAIDQMQQEGKTIDQIAVRLGKTKRYVFNRLRFLSLIPEIQEMFVANRISIQAATDIAGVSEEAQQEIFAENFKDWKDNAHLFIQNANHLLRFYFNDLHKAPFDTEDQTLVPAAGACSGCPFNSATLQTLFPELAKAAQCSNRECYRSKCQSQFVRALTAAIAEHQPEALVYGQEPNAVQLEALQAMPEAAGLPLHYRYNIRLVRPPQQPDEKDYYDEENGELDEVTYQAALLEYEEDSRQFELDKASGIYKTGLYISSANNPEVLLFDESSSRPSEESTKVTAKAVQEALKNGTATPELLEAEIVRITDREKRSQQLDREKVQDAIYQTFYQQTTETDLLTGPTDADQIAVRFLLLSTLGYGTRAEVSSVLKEDAEDAESDCYSWLASLTEAQFAYLIRMTILNKPESKQPDCTTAQCLYHMAEAAGIDIAAIQQTQQDKADDRQSKQKARIEALQKKIKRLRAKQQQAVMEEK